MHPKSCQGDRQTRQPSQHNGLNWNEAEIGDPSADSWVYSAGAGLWPGETLAVTPSPSWGSPTSGINSGVHLLPPKRRTQDLPTRTALTTAICCPLSLPAPPGPRRAGGHVQTLPQSPTRSETPRDAHGVGRGTGRTRLASPCHPNRSL